MNIIKVAALQTTVYECKQDTHDNLKHLFEINNVKNADLVTLPEMFNCPYDTQRFRAYAEPPQGETWRICSQLAAENGVYLSAGSIPEEDETGQIFNTAYVFDRKGREIAKHRKVHLFDINITGGQYFKESDTLTAGDKITIFDTEFGKMGLCICYDFRFPEMARLMALQGAKVLLAPGAFNMTTGPAHWELLFKSRALDNQVYCIGTAPARDVSGPYVSWGHSIITGPWGDIIAGAGENECILTAGLDLDIIKKVRQELPLLAHRRKDIYNVEVYNDN